VSAAVADWAELAAALDRELAGVPAPALREAYRRLSARYRADRPTPASIGPVDVLAYAAARMPATLAAVERVLADLASLRPGWRPVSAVDLGAGPGPAGWAAAAAFPSLARLTFVERAPAMVDLGRRLAAASPSAVVRDADWLTLTDADATEARPAAVLVIASYLLGEVGDPSTAAGAWWDATEDCLVVVEPGTPAGYRRVMEARDALIARGATILAPCPHDGPCPLLASGTGTGWCHFAARVTRTARHRAVKEADLNFEDEKHSYLVATRSPRPGGAPVERVVGRPRHRPGHVLLSLCGPDGLEDVVVARSQAGDYRRARKLVWGDHIRR
jgi:ribosomal protein RSM22 (predicted rRNA methylase)